MSETIHLFLFMLCVFKFSWNHVYIHATRIRQMCKHCMAVSTIQHHHHHHYSHLLHFIIILSHCIIYASLSRIHTQMDVSRLYDTRRSMLKQSVPKNLRPRSPLYIGITVYIRTYIFETSQHVRTFKWRQRCDVKYWHSTIDVFVVCCTFRSTCSKNFMVQPL